MWQRLVDKKDEWIGGTLVDCGDDMDRAWGLSAPNGTGERTLIVDFKLTDDEFNVIGEEFTCGGGRQHVGLSPYETPGDENTLTFRGYGNHQFYLIPPKKALTSDPDSS